MTPEVPITPGNVVVAGVVLTFLINGLLDYAKSFELFARAPGDVFRALSFALGIVGFVAASFMQNGGLPVTPDAWILLVVLGLAEGLAAGTAYDNRQQRKLNTTLKRIKRESAGDPGAAGPQIMEMGLPGRATLSATLETEIEGDDADAAMERLEAVIGDVAQYRDGVIVVEDGDS